MFLCLIKHYAIKMCREVKAPCSAFSNSTFSGGFTPWRLYPLLKFSSAPAGRETGWGPDSVQGYLCGLSAHGYSLRLALSGRLILKRIINVIQPERRGNSTLYQTSLLQTQKVLILVLLRYEDMNWIQSFLVNIG